MSYVAGGDTPAVTVPSIRTRKRRDGATPIVMVTAYDEPGARIVSDAGADIILVGDSVANTVLGYEDTLHVDIDVMAHHTAAVARARPRSLVLGDMPWMSYHLSPEDAVRNAATLVRAGAQAVKLEGGRARLPVVEAIVRAEIPVMGHLGLTPQSVLAMGGFRVQGKSADAATALLDAAKALGHIGRNEANPARWRGHLDKLLPARSRIHQVQHLAALPYVEVSAFLASLRTREATAARGLEFLILTAARTGEVIGARWKEIDLLDKTWTVPASRMKAHREHRVPLAPRAIAILSEMQAARNGDNPNAFVFSGSKPGKPLSNTAFLMLMRRMGRGDLTAHGFRSSFRDWAAERTNYPSEVAEMALAHAVGDKVEAAYRRGDLFEKRRRLMAAWATFCATQKQESQSNVTALRQTG